MPCSPVGRSAKDLRNVRRQRYCSPSRAFNPYHEFLGTGLGQLTACRALWCVPRVLGRWLVFSGAGGEPRKTSGRAGRRLEPAPSADFKAVSRRRALASSGWEEGKERWCWGGFWGIRWALVARESSSSGKGRDARKQLYSQAWPSSSKNALKAACLNQERCGGAGTMGSLLPREQLLLPLKSDNTQMNPTCS